MSLLIKIENYKKTAKKEEKLMSDVMRAQVRVNFSDILKPTG